MGNQPLIRHRKQHVPKGTIFVKDKKMKKETFGQVKAMSVLLGLFHLFGYLFFGDYYLTGSFIHILFATSTGWALLIMPLISGKFLQIKIIKFSILFIGIIGIVKNIHMMVEALMLPPEPITFVIHLLVFIVLCIMIRGIIAPKHLFDNLFKAND